MVGEIWEENQEIKYILLSVLFKNTVVYFSEELDCLIMNRCNKT